MKQRYLVIDVASCFDCNNCFMACKDEHVGNDWSPYTEAQPRHGHRWMDIRRTERGQYPRVDVSYLPMPCQHCQVPACARAYPELVTRRHDGIVMIDALKAKGVKGLVESCPYGAIYWNEEANVAQKCTMCAHLLDGDQQPNIPRCVHSCPTNAIESLFLEPEEMGQKVREEGLEAYRPELGTEPNVFYRNLYRFEKVFVAGGLLKDGECAEGIEVALRGGGPAAGGRLLTETTDCFGDFKFDALLPGEYRLEIAGRELETVRVDTSVNVGTIVI